MKYLLQVRKDIDEMGIVEMGKHKPCEKDWVNKEGSYDTLDQAVNEGRSIIQRDLHKAKNVRVVAVVAEFETRLVVEEAPLS